MPLEKRLLACAAAILLGTVLVDATPTLTFPINAQVPPVARPSEPFYFTFSSSTFAAGTESIFYSISGAPAWLQLESHTRVLWGTPSTEDVGDIVFQLTASDEDGSTSSSVTLVVAQGPGPKVGVPLLPQLAGFGRVSSPSSLLLLPLQAFAFAFAADSFSNTTANTNYYAVSANNSPLPSWIQFDGNGIAFSGLSPPLVSTAATPQVYAIDLIASDIVGFSQAIANFQIIVGYHQLAFSAVSQTFNVSTNQPFSTPPIRRNVLLDGTSLKPNEMQSVTSNAPYWVLLDAENLILSGRPPFNMSTTEVIISIVDVFGDVLNITVVLEITPKGRTLFTGDVPNLNATLGTFFFFSLKNSVVHRGTLTVTATLGNSSSWLQFDSATYTFQGSVPQNISTGTTTMIVTATDGEVTEQEVLQLEIFARGDSNMPINTTSTSSQTYASTITPSQTLNAEVSGSGNPSNSRITLIIVLAVILPILFLLFCLFLRHYLKTRSNSLKANTHLTDNQTATQLESVREGLHSPLATIPEAESVREADVAGHISPAGPPRIDLPWAPDSFRYSRDRFSKRLQEDQRSSRDSSWARFVDSGANIPQGAALEPDQNGEDETLCVQPGRNVLACTPQKSYKRRQLRSLQFTRQEGLSNRTSKALSSISSISEGLPHRLSGAGHGSGGFSPPQVQNYRSSWQTVSGSMPTIESRGSTMILGEYLSGKGPEEEFCEVEANANPATIRLVPSESTHLSPVKGQKLEEKPRSDWDEWERSKRFSQASFSKDHSGFRLASDGQILSEDVVARSVRPERGTSRRGLQYRWSRLSGVGPALIDTSPCQNNTPPSRPFMTARLHGDRSIASSGQFESPKSSEFDWEDKNLVEEEDTDGHRRWHASGRNEGPGTPSPRLPFEPSTTVKDQPGESEQNTPRSFKLADKRRPVSIEKHEQKEKGRSQHGSLRFV